MKVIINEEAKEYMKKKGWDEIYIEAGTRGCCGSAGIYVTSIHKGEPKSQKHLYKMYESEGKKVHVPRFMPVVDNTIEIGTEEFLRFKNLAILNLKEYISE